MSSGTQTLEPIFNFGPFPTLETDRLVLRELDLDDAAAVYAFRSDEEVARYNSDPPYTSINQARQLIADIRKSYSKKMSLRWGVVLKGESDVIGMCGYNYWNQTDRRGSIGYDLAQPYWHRGIMSEAVRAVVAFGFDQMHLNRIEADCTAENEASARLLRRLGFQQEGVEREQYFEDGRFWDLLLFSLLRREYKG